MSTIVKCPTCQAEVIWQPSSQFRPFCSKRCQLIDLGEWTEQENRTISTPMGASQSMTPEQIEEIEQMLAANEQGFFKD